MSTQYEQQQVFGAVLDIFNAVDATYAIWGGVAVAAWGEPRFTQDMDILLDGNTLLLPQFIQRLREQHFHVDQISVEKAIFEGGFFNLIHQPYGIKVDIYVPREPRFMAMLAGRIELPFDEIRRAYYISATSLIIAKLIAFADSRSTRHFEDIESILRIQSATLNLSKIDTAAIELNLFERWRALLDSK